MTPKTSSIILISDEPAITSAVKGALRPEDNFEIDIQETTLSAINGQAVKLAEDNDLIVFRLHPDTDRAAVEKLREQSGTKGTLLALSDQPISLADARELKKSGIDEILPFPLSEVELRDQLLELAGRSPQLPAIIDRSTRPGEVIAVAPVRGGIGATTLAINLANELQHKTGRLHKTADYRVALIDLDLQFGTLASAMDLEPSDAFYRMAKDYVTPDRTFLTQSFQDHKSGLTVLTAPDKFVPLDALQQSQVDALIGQLQREYDYIVVDMPRTLVDWVAPVVSRCAHLMLVTDTTVPSIRQAKRLIDFYSEERLNVPVDIVVNREKKPMLPHALHKEAAKVLERPLKYWLPDDPKRTRVALDRGDLLADGARCPLVGGIRRIAKTIISETKAPAASRI